MHVGQAPFAVHMRVLVHVCVFLLFSANFSTPMLPFYDYPKWHTSFEELADNFGPEVWQNLNRLQGSNGRFMPLYFFEHAAALVLNSNPAIAYWLITMLNAQLLVWVIIRLVYAMTHSQFRGCAAALMMFLTPHFSSTYSTSIHSEVMQLPLIALTLLFSYDYVFSARAWCNLVYAAIAMLAALLVKETAVAVLGSAGLWCAFLYFARDSRWKRAFAILVSFSFVTAVWLLWRSLNVVHGEDTYANSTMVADYRQIPKVLTMWVFEVCFAFPLVISGAVMLLRGLLRKGRGFQSNDENAIHQWFLFSCIASFVGGFSLISHVNLRYFTPVLMFAAVYTAIAFPSFQTMNFRVPSIMCVALIALPLLNNTAAAVTIRSLEVGLARFQYSLWQAVSKVPEGSLVGVEVPIQSGNLSVAQSLDWMENRYSKVSGSFRTVALDHWPLDRQPDFIVEVNSLHVWLGTDSWSLNGGGQDFGESFKASRVASAKVAVCGWQLRGIDFLVWAKSLLSSDLKERQREIGIVTYRMEWVLFRSGKIKASFP